jgi:hypothetical protein
MVEVFRTNVQNPHYARMLAELIELTFRNCRVNFDLEDCDHVMRIKYEGIPVHTSTILSLMHSLGFNAEELPDEVPQPAIQKHITIRT